MKAAKFQFLVRCIGDELPTILERTRAHRLGVCWFDHPLLLGLQLVRSVAQERPVGLLQG